MVRSRRWGDSLPFHLSARAKPPASAQSLRSMCSLVGPCSGGSPPSVGRSPIARPSNGRCEAGEVKAASGAVFGCLLSRFTETTRSNLQRKSGHLFQRNEAIRKSGQLFGCRGRRRFNPSFPLYSCLFMHFPGVSPTGHLFPARRRLACDAGKKKPGVGTRASSCTREGCGELNLRELGCGGCLRRVARLTASVCRRYRRRRNSH